jgi:tRNA threonylcarbamoyladenosine biosynthesis protein TsaB
MIILAISTSSARGTVAVLRREGVLARVAYDGGTAHAERLFGAIDEAMREAGAVRGDLRAIACDVGPGSFTGVRVGVCACQGIAVGLGIPAVGVGSLDAMTAAARAVAGPVAALAVLDAKKGEVFAAIHAPDGAPSWGPLHLPRGDASSLLAARHAHGAAVVVGEAAAGLEGLGAPVRGEALDLPDATHVGRRALVRLAQDPPASLDAAQLEPLYVRAPDARPLASPPPGDGPV